MALTDEQIKLLLSKSQAKFGGRKKKSDIDTSVRDHLTWFKLAHKMLDNEGNNLKCENANCPDTRPVQLCTVIEGVTMCRRCFLDGYGLVDFNQLAINNE